MKKTKIICLAHQKGGVGKTLMCNLIAGEVSKQGHSVAIIDADRQASIHAKRTQQIQNGEQSTFDVFNLSKYKEVEALIEQSSGQYDYIFIDTPGVITPDIQKILKRADAIIIPLTAGDSDWSSFQTFVHVLNEILDNSILLIAVYNKVKHQTNRWKEYMSEVTPFLEENMIILPEMKTTIAGKRQPAQLGEREDYTPLDTITPLTNRKVNRACKIELKYLVHALLSEIE